jgi:1,2-diacylglycerol 3-beta-galactosyltransferase
MADRTEVLLFVIDAGGGHRAAANALTAAAERTGRPWTFRILNLQSLLDHLDFTKHLTGHPMEEAYNVLLRRRWTSGFGLLLKVLHGLIALFHGPLVASLARSLAAYRPAAVVSVLPNFNGVIRDAVRAAHPGVPFLVVLTDLADFPPRFWIEPGVDRVIVGTEHAARQARALGLPPERISLTSGMVLHPRFYPRPGAEIRAALRAEQGIPRDAFVLLLLFGGKGSPEMQPLAAALLPESPRWHVVAICGDNPGLYERLGVLEAEARGRLHRVGFTDRVADHLAACDVLVTKPGPGSLSEAFHVGVPVVVVRDRHTIPQERFNTEFVAERRLGVVVPHWRKIPAAAAALAGDVERMARMRANLAALPENRAVWEVLDIIEKEQQGSQEGPVCGP